MPGLDDAIATARTGDIWLFRGRSLAARRPSSWYDPGKFWSGDRIEMVPPFALGPEIAIDT